MNRTLPMISDDELAAGASSSRADVDEPGFGSLKTQKGLLPLESMEVTAPDRRPPVSRHRPPDVRQRTRRAARGGVHLPTARSPP